MDFLLLLQENQDDYIPFTLNVRKSFDLFDRFGSYVSFQILHVGSMANSNSNYALAGRALNKEDTSQVVKLMGIMTEGFTELSI